MRARILVVGAAVALAAGCGSAGDGTPGARQPLTSVPTQPELAAALQAWQDFPASRQPRPIVLLQELPVVTGFSTDAAKRAVSDANYEFPAQLPTTPPTVTVQLPDGTAELPALPVEDAVAGLRGERKEGSRPPGRWRETLPNPADALPVTRVELGTADFLTDRGSITLPSWLFHPADALGPIAWPALQPDAFWRFAELTPGHLPPATLAADGTTVTVQLPAPSPACPGESMVRHEPVVAESAAAVAVTVRQVVVSMAPGPPVTNCAHDLMLRFEAHELRLADPLGARALVDENGAPLAVTTS